MFEVSNINIENFSYPKVTVQVWSRVFGNDDNIIGSFNVEAKEGDKRITLYSEDVERGQDQTSIREYCNELAEEWNEDLKENWNKELTRCFKKLRDYEQRQIDEVKKHQDNLSKYEKNIKLLEIN